MEDQLSIAMTVFRKHFLPVEHLEQSDETLSTNEILEYFENLLGEGKVTESNLTDLLLKEGFSFDFIQGEGFKWMFKIA